MKDAALDIHSASYLTRILWIGCILLLLLDVWLGYKLTRGTFSSSNLLFMCLVSLMAFFLTAAESVDKLLYKDGVLTHKTLLGSRYVTVTKLIRAERYTSSGRYGGSRNLYLEDSDGNSVHIMATKFWFDEGFGRLIGLLQPYIFTPAVDKNFMTLDFMGIIRRHDGEASPFWRPLLRDTVVVLVGLVVLFIIVAVLIIIFAPKNPT